MDDDREVEREYEESANRQGVDGVWPRCDDPSHDGKKPNVMTISWTMVNDFMPAFVITTGAWNYSFAAP